MPASVEYHVDGLRKAMANLYSEANLQVSHELPYGEDTVILNFEMVWPEDIARFPNLPGWRKLKARELTDREAGIAACLDIARKLSA
jgi:hypothetical protein